MHLLRYSLLLWLLHICAFDAVVTKSRIKRRHVHHDEVELRRTKRTIYQALLKRQERRNADNEGVDIDERSLINKPQSRKKPYVKQQVQDVKVRVEVIHEWRDEMTNRTSPEYELLAGNIVDAVGNELTADLHYVSSAVSKLTKTKSKHKIIADVIIRFFKTEADPVSHIQGIINKGWISGQQVDPNYFKIIGVVNGNNEKPKWHYPDGVELRVIPAMIAPGGAPNTTASSVNNTKTEARKEKPTRYKEIRISIKLKQRYQMFLEDTNSPEFRELSGNVEQAIAKIFTHDALYIEAHVIEFKESSEGRVIVNCAMHFKVEESYAIEKCQAMISSGDLAGMPVDEQYFVVNGMNQVSNTNTSGKQKNNSGAPPSNNLVQYPASSGAASSGGQSKGTPENAVPSGLTTQDGSSVPMLQDIPQPQPVIKTSKPKPLKYKEIRISLKLKETWNTSLSNNLTKPYAILSGIIEQAVDRGLAANLNYIDTTVIDFIPGPEQNAVVNIAVRFHIEEDDPEGQLRNLIKTGSLREVPVDDTFFFVFSLSETVPKPKSEEANGKTAAVTNVKLGVPAPEGNQEIVVSGTQGGQKQQAEYKPNILNTAKTLKPSNVGVANEHPPTTQSPLNITTPVAPTNPTEAVVSATFNPYLPKETSPGPYQKTGAFSQSASPVLPPGYLDTSQGTVNLNAQDNVLPYSQNGQQSWYPVNTPESVTYNPHTPVGPQMQDTTTYNPYKPIETQTQPNVLANDALNTTQIPSQTTTQENVIVNTTDNVGTGTPSPVATYVQGSSSEVFANEIEGTMTLEQSWHPYLADKSNPVYKILEQTVVNSIKNVYSTVNEEVTPTILGFSETNIPISSVSVTTEKKVAVRFMVTFLPTEKASSKPLEDAVAAKSVAGILIHQNSLVIAASAINTLQNGTHVTGKALTICQKQQKLAQSETDSTPVGEFAPQCKVDGSYAAVQCHALTGFCWCVNKAGVRISGTEERYKQPNCLGIKVMGITELPEASSTLILSGSCLTVFVQEMVSCGGDINCHIPVIANKTIRNITVENNSVSYELVTTKLKPGRYVMSAVLNNGWCRVNSLKSKEMIRAGDFHTTTMHDITVEEKTKVVERNLQLDAVHAEETGIKLHGRVFLPTDEISTSLPTGSCLSIQTKQLKLCTGPNCPTTPTSGNDTIKDLLIVNNSIPYNVHLPELEPGTYVISAVLHVGQCPESDQTMRPGDYYNDEMVDYVVAMETTDVEKDIPVVMLREENSGGVYVSGRVLIPSQEPLPQRSCLTVSSRKLIQCKNNNCKIPPVSTRTFENITNEGGIPYSLLLPVATPGRYIISAVVNLGWCKVEDGTKWIKSGDYYNEKVHDFEIKNTTTSVAENINVMLFETDEEKSGVTVHGRVILPPSSNTDFPSNSCLTIKAQEFKLCGGVINCVNPITAKQTFMEPKIENNVLPYAIVLPNVASGHHIISAVLNVGWCKETNPASDEWIKNGDYHNEETNDFVIESHEVEKDIEVMQYFEIVTAPTISVQPPATKPATGPPITNTPDLATTHAPPPTQITQTSASSNLTDVQVSTTAENNGFLDQVAHNTASTLPNSNQNVELKPTADMAAQKVPGKETMTTATPSTFGEVRTVPPTASKVNNGSNGVSSGAQPLLNELEKNSTDQIITLPAGLPKSCEEIREAGIGNMDGQYIIEARAQCHLSIICQGMERTKPKEFLGGPSEDEWKYWHYAVLIKISDHDKQNIPAGACLENTASGKNLIKRVLIAGGKQDNPISEWKTNISKLLRSKRSIVPGDTLITKAKKIYKDKKESNLMLQSEWGVL